MKLLFLFINYELIYYLISVNYSQYEPITLFDQKASHYIFNLYILTSCGVLESSEQMFMRRRNAGVELLEAPSLQVVLQNTPRQTSQQFQAYHWLKV